MRGVEAECYMQADSPGAAEPCLRSTRSVVHTDVSLWHWCERRQPYLVREHVRHVHHPMAEVRGEHRQEDLRRPVVPLRNP
jgi:hypothetical protein